jgi:hypothetical protein
MNHPNQEHGFTEAQYYEAVQEVNKRFKSKKDLYMYLQN